MGPRLAEGFIWASTPPDGQQCYVVFRKTFDLPAAPRSAAIHLFADTRYLLWVNGTFIDRGPCRFDPKRPEYDTHELTSALKTGRNSMAVLVHYYAVGSFREWNQQCARMMEHRARPDGLRCEWIWTTADGSSCTPTRVGLSNSHTLPAFPRKLFVGTGQSGCPAG